MHLSQIISRLGGGRGRNFPPLTSSFLKIETYLVTMCHCSLQTEGGMILFTTQGNQWWTEAYRCNLKSQEFWNRSYFCKKKLLKKIDGRGGGVFLPPQRGIGLNYTFRKFCWVVFRLISLSPSKCIKPTMFCIHFIISRPYICMVLRSKTLYN